ncbi:MAG: hypothetical protein JST43_10370 [Bacteroidetes bacterium]|nr:hypothetical protein [Bacteroidota bacterium]MBS1540495.1 hypothetical protein [Bacteroidota bacterium]
MKTKLHPVDYVIELSTSSAVVILYFLGHISVGIAALGLALCLSLSLPRKR